MSVGRVTQDLLSSLPISSSWVEWNGNVGGNYYTNIPRSRCCLWTVVLHSFILYKGSDWSDNKGNGKGLREIESTFRNATNGTFQTVCFWQELRIRLAILVIKLVCCGLDAQCRRILLCNKAISMMEGCRASTFRIASLRGLLFWTLEVEGRGHISALLGGKTKLLQESNESFISGEISWSLTSFALVSKQWPAAVR